MASGTIKAVVPKSDIVNNLTTNDSTKVLSAAQGKALSDQIANIPVIQNGTRTASTDAQGLVSLAVNISSNKIIFAVYGNGSTDTNIYIPFLFENIWHARVLSSISGNPIASTSVTMHYSYYVKQ